MKYALVFAIAVALGGCDNAAETDRTLRAAGFTEIVVTGWAPMACGKDDTWSTGFTAKNPNGRHVSGVVCCGLIFKSCTIRF